VERPARSWFEKDLEVCVLNQDPECQGTEHLYLSTLFIIFILVKLEIFIKIRVNPIPAGHGSVF